MLISLYLVKTIHGNSIEDFYECKTKMDVASEDYFVLLHFFIEATVLLAADQ